MEHFEIKTIQNIPYNRIGDLLCTAIEGGIGYWCTINDCIKPETISFCWDENYTYKYIDYPLNGGSIILLDNETEDSYELYRGRIHQGLQIMATDYPKHYADFLNENEDAATGDVFIQCCVFGEVIYG
jgi:hypothetical protein